MKRKNLLACSLISAGAFSLVLGWPWGPLLGAILVLAGVIAFKSQPHKNTDVMASEAREPATLDQTIQPDNDPIAEATHLQNLISEMERRGVPIPADLNDRLISLVHMGLEKSFHDFDGIMANNGNKLVDLSGFARDLRAEQNWPPSGSIVGNQNADEKLDFLLSRIEALGGQVPVREGAAITALCSEGLEAHYMRERLKRGWPSMFANEQNLDWRERPGFYEKYLKKRHNNVPFPPSKRCVSRYDLYFARQLDERERIEFLETWKTVMDPIINSPDHATSDAAVKHLKQFFELLESAAAIGGDLDEYIESLRSAHRALVEQLLQVFGDCSDAAEALRTAEEQRWSTSEFCLNPSIGYLQRIPDKADFVPALLSEPTETTHLLIKYVGPSAMDPVTDEVKKMMNERTEIRNYLQFHPQKLAALGLTPVGV